MDRHLPRRCTLQGSAASNYMGSLRWPLVGPLGVVPRRSKHETTHTPISYLSTHFCTFSTAKSLLKD